MISLVLGFALFHEPGIFFVPSNTFGRYETLGGGGLPGEGELLFMVERRDRKGEW